MQLIPRQRIEKSYSKKKGELIIYVEVRLSSGTIQTPTNPAAKNF